MNDNFFTREEAANLLPDIFRDNNLKTLTNRDKRHSMYFLPYFFILSNEQSRFPLLLFARIGRRNPLPEVQ